LRVTDVGQTLDVKMQLLIISQQLLELLTVISQRYVVNTLLLRSLVRPSVCLCPSVCLERTCSVHNRAHFPESTQ